MGWKKWTQWNPSSAKDPAAVDDNDYSENNDDDNDDNDDNDNDDDNVKDKDNADVEDDDDLIQPWTSNSFFFPLAPIQDIFLRILATKAGKMMQQLWLFASEDHSND